MKTAFLLFCLLPIFSFTQTRDDFSDGNFTENPSWLGDSGHFEVNALKQLHLCGKVSDTSMLFTRTSSSAEMEWSFWIKLSFNTSANNHVRIYLAMDTIDLQRFNGYYLQVGGTDDSLFIIRQQDEVLEKIYRIRSYKTLHSTNTLRFKITREVSGIWKVMADSSGGYNFFMDGTFMENPMPDLGWFGICCRYTSSNATKVYFDDFYAGPVIHDTIPPRVTMVEIPSQKQVRLLLSESIQKESAENCNNYFYGLKHKIPDSARIDTQSSSVVTLFLHDSLSDGNFDTLIIHGLIDLSGNQLNDTAVVISYYKVKAFDILINEILADPEPSVGLPEGEFVELYNQTLYPINLKNWSFTFGNITRFFPAIVISPKGYLLIVKDTTYLSFGSIITLFTSSSSLSNQGATLVLKDQQQHVIHSVSYSPEWYSDSYKEEGGWSLEMIDVSNPCGCEDNWEASRGINGGTPGGKNSVMAKNQDCQSPVALKANILDLHHVAVYFSESMDTSMIFPGCFVIEPGPIIPLGISFYPPLYNSLNINVNDPFQKGVTYRLISSGKMTDCAGNQLDTSQTIRFAIPDSIQPSDVVINEILPNPEVHGSRFIELFNRSERVIDLQSLVISNIDTLQGQLPGASPLIQEGQLLFPGDYLVFSESPRDICERYYVPFPNSLVTMTGLPAFDGDSGTVILARKDNLMIIDKMHYSGEMHYPLLVKQDGVSLERFSADQPSMNPENWHSAAETAGFATPGYQNSHRMEPLFEEGEITVFPEVFSPDNDGRDDYLNIAIRMPDPDCSVTLVIYDGNGRLVRHLVNNVLLSNQQIFTWDGMTGENLKASIGFYILFIEVTKPDGVVMRKKRTTVLGGKF